MLASDGETRRGSDFIHLTFKHELSQKSPLYSLLQHLGFLNFFVGDDDLTCDKDYKHIFKRFRNLFVRPRGVTLNHRRITPDTITNQFKVEGLSPDHIQSLFNPDDKQDVKMALDMLKDIWSLSRASQSTNFNQRFLDNREALWILGKFLFHLVFPYLCIDLSLSEQVEHLSAAAHLALALYKQASKEFIPTGLYVDLMIMIKNIIFCIAKAKVDDLDGEFFPIQLGTDRLEELFRILRTMVGNDANVDMLQLVSRLSGTTEVANILAKYPHWDSSPRRLKFNALTRESKEIPDSADHSKPPSWRGNARLKNVSLQTSWNWGRRLVKEECEVVKPILEELEKAGADILSPFFFIFRMIQMTSMRALKTHMIHWKRTLKMQPFELKLRMPFWQNKLMRRTRLKELQLNVGILKKALSLMVSKYPKLMHFLNSAKQENLSVQQIASNESRRLGDMVPSTPTS